MKEVRKVSLRLTAMKFLSKAILEDNKIYTKVHKTKI